MESIQSCAGTNKIQLPQYRYGGLGFRGHGEWNGKENSFFLTSNGESDRIKAMPLEQNGVTSAAKPMVN